MKKPAIPPINIPDRNLMTILGAMKENIEIITGSRPKVPAIAQLSSSASTNDIINKINEIITRLNATGT